MRLADQLADPLGQLSGFWGWGAMLQQRATVLVDFPEQKLCLAALACGVVLGLLVWESVTQRDGRHRLFVFVMPHSNQCHTAARAPAASDTNKDAQPWN